MTLTIATFSLALGSRRSCYYNVLRDGELALPLRTVYHSWWTSGMVRYARGSFLPHSSGYTHSRVFRRTGHVDFLRKNLLSMTLRIPSFAC